MKGHIKNKVFSAAGEIFKSIHHDSTYTASTEISQILVDESMY